MYAVSFRTISVVAQIDIADIGTFSIISIVIQNIEANIFEARFL